MKKPPPIPEDEIFHAAKDMSAQDRATYLSLVCDEDRELRRRIEHLLASHENTVFMPPSPRAASETEAMLGRLKPEEPGDHIGSYKLLQEIGEGGFGTVWMAEQESPVRRRVALKVIKVGLDTREVIARFEQERQALALMDHPNIAKVLDGGATQYGRPFFVMDLIKGKKITEYCDDEGLGIRERLELFVQVCAGLQHAHQKGIIHRDLKPSNILVTKMDGQAVPKVIDFGVAKALHGPLTVKTLFTRFEQMVGTLMYMSPEQAEMTSQDIDTRSDLYSLGILLYELLTGCTPIDAKTIEQGPLDKIRHLIREVDPLRPSLRVKTLAPETLTTTAKCRASEPRKLSGSIRGDLDWIVMKCIEKDRKRRYESANSLALDIQRHLDDEPVTARPPTYGYLLGRFIRRNKLATSAAAAVAVALILGAAVSWSQALRAITALKAVRVAEEDTRAFSDFLVKRVLAAARPQDVEGGLGIDVTVVRALEQAEKKLAQDFAGRPHAEAVARAAIGVTWETLGRHQEAARQFEKEIELREQDARSDDLPILKAKNNLAVAYQKAGSPEKALPLYEKVLMKRRELLPPDHPDVILSMNNLAGAYSDLERIKEALALYQQALDAGTSTLGPEDPRTLKTLSNLARVWRAGGISTQAFPLKALPLYKHAVEASETKLGENHPDTLTCMNNLAICNEQAGDVDMALPLYEKALQRSKASLGDDHPDTLTSMSNLAGAYRRIGDLPKAIGLYEQALAKGRIKPGAEHPDSLDTMLNLALAYEESKRLQDAMPLYREVLSTRTAKLGRDHPRTLKAMSYLAVAYSVAGEEDKALPLFKLMYETRKTLLGPENPDTLKSMYNLACSYQAMKELQSSLILFEELLVILNRMPLPKGYPQVPEVTERTRDIRLLLNPARP